MPEVKSAHSGQIETFPLQNQIHRDKTYGATIYLSEIRVWILITKHGLLPVNRRSYAAGQDGT